MEKTLNMKMTSIGPIPEDWEVITIAAVGQDFSYGVGAEAIPYNGEDKYIRITDINDESHRYTPEPVTSPSFFNENHLLKKNDIVVARTGASVGKSYLYNTNDGKLVFAGFLMKFNVPDVDARYVAYHFFTKRYWQWVNSESARTGQPGLNIQQLKQFSFPSPTDLQEQKRIADALSGIDDMIGALDEAIAKKRQIKEGLMQQLLTGKTRLPGFCGEWVEMRFDDFISRFATGLNPRSNFRLNVDASNYYITIKDFADGVLYFDHCDKVSDDAIKRINERSDLRTGDVLFSSIGRVGDAYVIEETPTNWNINESVFSLRPNPTIVDSHFLYYLIKSTDAQAKFQESITGTTLRSIKMGHLKEIVCCFPSNIEEQKAIANALKNIDADIISSETMRDKYRLIKQGMMQELLTGKTRL